MTSPQPLTQQSGHSLDFFNLARLVWRKKLLILFCAIFTTAVGALYAFVLSTPVYQTRIYFLPPQTGDYSPLNVGRGKEVGLLPYTQETVFKYATDRLGSSGLLQQFLRDREPALAKLPTIPAKELLRNDWRITVEAPNPRGRNLYALTVSGHSVDESYDGLQHYLKLLQESTSKALMADAGDDINFLKENAQRTINEMRMVAESQRKDRIAQLQEAIRVASAGDLRNPDISVPQPGSRTGNSLIDASQARLRPYYADSGDLYNRGLPLLSAELKAIQARNEDDPFIPGLRINESELRQLSEIKYDPAAIRAFRLDGDIVRPDAPARPNKPLILFLALLAGLGMGVGYVLLRAVIENE
ncbi:Polysaccharide antigen chain regulator [Bordetella ansorpii]|jgi:chain length determinant protein (polysaccharide antigen chain regulator)|uniref:Polysaccharide antigen chain regulator n=1 Tax=Bordetella ansorpii TaxID=288768 RepID=A0A157R1X4_9BORD|nr:Wzz/FepE/Etk N-terminal domain-containing protein [Bordetella ansorpii]SAI51814.1 Polysaccharide antigen chain regulator [Bordetella ansorpii]